MRSSKMTSASPLFLLVLLVASPGLATVTFIEQNRSIAYDTWISPPYDPNYHDTDSASATDFGLFDESLSGYRTTISQTSSLTQTSISASGSFYGSGQTGGGGNAGWTASNSSTFEVIFSVDVTTDYTLETFMDSDVMAGNVEIDWWFGTWPPPVDWSYTEFCDTHGFGQPGQVCGTTSTFSGTLAPGTHRLRASSFLESYPLDNQSSIETGNYSINLSLVPEPSTALLFGLGLVGLGLRRRR